MRVMPRRGWLSSSRRDNPHGGRTSVPSPSLAKRRELIARIQTLRNSVVVAYVTGTRPNMVSPMAMDAVRRIHDHVGGQHFERLDLFIHSNGGYASVPWTLVTVLRECADHLAVLVPHRAFSSATLLALGADEIVMHPMGSLGPTDASVASPYGDLDPDGYPVELASEDVNSFIAMAKTDFCLASTDLTKVMEILALKVHPVHLGAVKRGQAQAQLVARKLLELHMDPGQSRKAIDSIVSNLTTAFYDHSHGINRQEAIELGLKVNPNRDDELEHVLWDLYLEYEREMLLEVPFRPSDIFLEEFAGSPIKKLLVMPRVKIEGVRIESLGRSDCFSTELTISGRKEANGHVDLSMNVQRQGWWEDC
jgi:hypothetical protein